jgi:hypothetical protein
MLHYRLDLIAKNTEMRKLNWQKRLRLAAVLLFLGVAPIYASPVLYNMSFTAFPLMSIEPTSGSFYYDASAPVGSQFTDFSIVWDGFTFDLTNAGNYPSVQTNSNTSACIPSLDSAGFFAGLTMPSNCSSLTTHWSAEAGFSTGFPGTFAAFNIEIGGPDNMSNLQANVLESVSYSGPELGNEGRWSVNVATPEPAAMPALLIGSLACMVIKRRTQLQPDRQSS